MNTVWLLILLLTGILLFGTSSVTGVSTVHVPVVAPTSRVEINGNPGVILDASRYRPDAEGWTPAESDLRAAEDAVLTAPAGDREPVTSGYRQYVGIVEDDDRKIIINSMCTHFDGWETSYIEVMDGGPCFWSAVYNVDSGDLEMLIVNGEA